MWADQVRFMVRLCPHVIVNVKAVETWGVHHRYQFTGRCQTCGPVSAEKRLAAYAG